MYHDVLPPIYIILCMIVLVTLFVLIYVFNIYAIMHVGSWRSHMVVRVFNWISFVDFFLYIYISNDTQND